MFLLSCMKDNVKISPSSFGKPQSQAIIECLNEKYSNRVVYNLGLCVSVWDLVEIEDPIVYPGEGGSFVKVTFRMAIFKPFIGQVLVGKVKYSDEEGIKGK
jgi:DNA-directed RNA polymerase III subunit RPC8